MRYVEIPRLLNTIDAFCHGQATLFDISLIMHVNFNTLRTALLRMELITISSEPSDHLTTDTLTHAILFYYLLLATGKRKKE